METDSLFCDETKIVTPHHPAISVVNQIRNDNNMKLNPRPCRSGFGTSVTVLEWSNQIPDLHTIDQDLRRDLKMAGQTPYKDVQGEVG